MLTGGEGADNLSGGDGDDMLKGNAGLDTIDGGSGSDTVDYSDEDKVTIDLSDLASEPGPDGSISDPGGVTPRLKNVENVIAGDSADSLTGDKGANTLTGGAGNDTLDGGDGNDTLVAGAGADDLTGGGGADTFVFGEDDASNRKDAENQIMDFSKEEGDKIDLTEFGLSSSDLDAIIAGAEIAAGTGKAIITLNLDDNTDGVDVRGGTIEVTMSEAFATLDADDFII